MLSYSFHFLYLTDELVAIIVGMSANRISNERDCTEDRCFDLRLSATINEDTDGNLDCDVMMFIFLILHFCFCIFLLSCS